MKKARRETRSTTPSNSTNSTPNQPTSTLSPLLPPLKQSKQPLDTHRQTNITNNFHNEQTMAKKRGRPRLYPLPTTTNSNNNDSSLSSEGSDNDSNHNTIQSRSKSHINTRKLRNQTFTVISSDSDDDDDINDEYRDQHYKQPHVSIEKQKRRGRPPKITTTTTPTTHSSQIKKKQLPLSSSTSPITNINKLKKNVKLIKSKSKNTSDTTNAISSSSSSSLAPMIHNPTTTTTTTTTTPTPPTTNTTHTTNPTLTTPLFSPSSPLFPSNSNPSLYNHHNFAINTFLQSTSNLHHDPTTLATSLQARSPGRSKPFNVSLKLLNPAPLTILSIPQTSTTAMTMAKTIIQPSDSITTTPKIITTRKHLQRQSENEGNDDISNTNNNDIQTDTNKNNKDSNNNDTQTTTSTTTPARMTTRSRTTNPNNLPITKSKPKHSLTTRSTQSQQQLNSTLAMNIMTAVANHTATNINNITQDNAVLSISDHNINPKSDQNDNNTTNNNKIGNKSLKSLPKHQLTIITKKQQLSMNKNTMGDNNDDDYGDDDDNNNNLYNNSGEGDEIQENDIYIINNDDDNNNNSYSNMNDNDEDQFNKDDEKLLKTKKALSRLLHSDLVQSDVESTRKSPLFKSTPPQPQSHHISSSQQHNSQSQTQQQQYQQQRHQQHLPLLFDTNVFTNDDIVGHDYNNNMNNNNDDELSDSSSSELDLRSDEDGTLVDVNNPWLTSLSDSIQLRFSPPPISSLSTSTSTTTTTTTTSSSSPSTSLASTLSTLSSSIISTITTKAIYKPTFLHQIFTDSLYLYGYKGLSIDIYINPTTLHTFISVGYRSSIVDKALDYRGRGPRITISHLHPNQWLVEKRSHILCDYSYTTDGQIEILGLDQATLQQLLLLKNNDERKIKNDEQLQQQQQHQQEHSVNDNNNNNNTMNDGSDDDINDDITPPQRQLAGNSSVQKPSIALEAIKKRQQTKQNLKEIELSKKRETVRSRRLSALEEREKDKKKEQELKNNQLQPLCQNCQIQMKLNENQHEQSKLHLPQQLQQQQQQQHQPHQDQLTNNNNEAISNQLDTPRKRGRPRKIVDENDMTLSTEQISIINYSPQLHSDQLINTNNNNNPNQYFLPPPLNLTPITTSSVNQFHPLQETIPELRQSLSKSEWSKIEILQGQYERNRIVGTRSSDQTYDEAVEEAARVVNAFTTNSNNKINDDNTNNINNNNDSTLTTTTPTSSSRRNKDNDNSKKSTLSSPSFSSIRTKNLDTSSISSPILKSTSTTTTNIVNNNSPNHNNKSKLSSNSDNNNNNNNSNNNNNHNIYNKTMVCVNSSSNCYLCPNCQQCPRCVQNIHQDHIIPNLELNHLHILPSIIPDADPIATHELEDHNGMVNGQPIRRNRIKKGFETDLLSIDDEARIHAFSVGDMPALESIYYAIARHFEPSSLCTSIEAFDATFGLPTTTFIPPGRHIGTYMRHSQLGLSDMYHNRSGRVDISYHFYLGSLADPNVNEYHRRAQPLLLYYIDTASFIDSTDHVWEILFTFQKTVIYPNHNNSSPSTSSSSLSDSTSTTSTNYINKNNHTNNNNSNNNDNEPIIIWKLIGFTTLYTFLKFPHSHRLRLSQILIMPYAQRSGHGLKMLECVYQMATIRNAFEVNIEDPSIGMQSMRDCCDVQRAIAMGLFQHPININDGHHHHSNSIHNLYKKYHNMNNNHDNNNSNDNNNNGNDSNNNNNIDEYTTTYIVDNIGPPNIPIGHCLGDSNNNNNNISTLLAINNNPNILSNLVPNSFHNNKNNRQTRKQINNEQDDDNNNHNNNNTIITRPIIYGKAGPDGCCRLTPQQMEYARTKLVITKLQCERVMECLCLAQLDQNDENQMREYRLRVKRRFMSSHKDDLTPLTTEDRKKQLQNLFDIEYTNYCNIHRKLRIR